MKTDKHLNMKRLATVAYICMALSSTVYAIGLSKSQIKCCANADQQSVTWTYPDGTKYVTHDQYDCCETGCEIANGGEGDATALCTAKCDPNGN